MKTDSLTVREWIGLFTDRKPSLPPALLDSPVSTTTRRELRPAVQWMAGLGVETGEPVGREGKRKRGR